MVYWYVPDVVHLVYIQKILPSLPFLVCNLTAAFPFPELFPPLLLKLTFVDFALHLKLMEGFRHLQDRPPEQVVVTGRRRSVI